MELSPTDARQRSTSDIDRFAADEELTPVRLQGYREQPQRLSRTSMNRDNLLLPASISPADDGTFRLSTRKVDALHALVSGLEG